MDRSTIPSGNVLAGDGDAWSPARLDAALLELRKSPCDDGSLWMGLVRLAPGTDAGLRDALLQGHAVQVLGESEWAKAQPTVTANSPRVPNGTLPVTVDNKIILLSEDPWAPETTLYLGRQGHGWQLALAKPGQIASIRQKAGGLADHGATQPKSTGSGSADSPVVSFVEQAIIKAYADGASDIHFETDRRGIGIKYRLDGVMATGERLEGTQRAEEVVSRIKVMAQLDITERRRPQDGRIHWDRQGRDSIDLRVSVMPSIHGEDVVLRLLDKAQLRQTRQEMSLDVLGFDPAVAAIIRALASRPHGMLLVTGPTGSGKTTTVYAALSEVNDGLEKIVTIEDPVEYELPGVLQIPVNEQKGLTFASGLRSILRHDPDKILVGEIRDAETAEIAVQSSLTGHLVFTTVHANSLFDVLGRFQHFDIDPFALASAINGVVVQRLLRRLCQHCVTWVVANATNRAALAALSLAPPEKLPLVNGCTQCRGTGYRGRFVVAEVHLLTDATRDLMVSKSSLSDLKRALYHDGSVTLLARAMEQVGRGNTTVEEVKRVVGLV